MKYNRKTGALCAVMLLLSWLLPLMPTAAAVGSVDPGDVYAVDIEYGSLAFYYDYGVWNVNTMRYEAAETSADPAADTPDGFPGWYGFDKTANCVRVINRSADKSITVELDYRSLTAAEVVASGAQNVVEGVSMSVIGADGVDWMENTVTVPAGLKDGEGKPLGVAGFVQLSGEPRVGGQRYNNEEMLPIGMFTLTITKWD